MCERNQRQENNGDNCERFHLIAASQPQREGQPCLARRPRRNRPYTNRHCSAQNRSPPTKAGEIQAARRRSDETTRELLRLTVLLAVGTRHAVSQEQVMLNGIPASRVYSGPEGTEREVLRASQGQAAGHGLIPSQNFSLRRRG